ncbi:thioredoxin-domain-containing protein [Guyanagaster necrorhizus]|uniref:Thioredoxin-domain-containing protein n=1 Tax=Guyanagaster necrorhizus TaxID=856835 RepID=A0A9P7VTI0_9AGAR|nr:thioredoxin-domain-containing protein [Guyanagaster necrorhizus MCA 3950]KAG7446145.1 thioredoxin-domain-containing protein [Guyanagaster necrorhizus MCA 3950]
MGDLIVVKTSVLTPDNFDTTIARGVWFIEYFSPYCGHCRKFAPALEQLVTMSAEGVNCAVNGDLCSGNGIKGYPTLNLYKDGKLVEPFKGSRDLDILVSFIKSHAPPPPPSQQQPMVEKLPNPKGVVLSLDDNTFETTLSEGPAFIKFFAPWFKCEDHKALCTSQEVQGYPSLMYYSITGAKNEYTNGRKLEQLAAFAERASGPAMKAIDPEDLEHYIAKDDIIYVLLHTDNDIVTYLTPTFSSLLGSPTVYTIANASESLTARYSIPASSAWSLIAFKDHDSDTPTSVYTTMDVNGVLTWLLANRLPSTSELTQDTFQSIMKAPSHPLVVLAGVSAEKKDLVKQRFEEISASFRSKSSVNREVVFAWMDIERWKDWMKSMYGIKTRSKALDDVEVVIADHHALIYWNVDAEGKPINLSNEKGMFSAIEGAARGKITPLHSENTVERLARYLNGKAVAIEGYVVNNPLRTVFFVGFGFVVVILAIRRWILSDLPDDRHYRGKAGRLD